MLNLLYALSILCLVVLFCLCFAVGWLAGKQTKFKPTQIYFNNYGDDDGGDGFPTSPRLPDEMFSEN